MPVLNRRLHKGTVAWREGIAAHFLGADLDQAADIAAAAGESPWTLIAEIEWAPLWIAYEDKFLREWTREHQGVRPFAWWLYSSQPSEPRVVAAGEWEPATSRSRWRDDGRPWGWPAAGSDVTFESQAHFLRRHGLLVRGEERRLSPDAFEPIGWREEPLV